MSSSQFLEVTDLTVRFGGLTAVDQVTLVADCGEVVGLIGPNGAGKTTSFGAILGFVTPTSGCVSIAGVDVTSMPVHRRGRMGISRTFQKVETFGSMTVRENLEFATEAARLGERPWRLLSTRRWQQPRQVDAILEQLDLTHVADEPAGLLPLGTARLVELGRALCARPSLLLLDEPSSGLDSAETSVFGAHLLAAVDEAGLGVLLIEHDMSLVSRVCERLYVLDFGRLLAEGPTAEVIASDAVRAAYLGSTHAA